MDIFVYIEHQQHIGAISCSYESYIGHWLGSIISIVSTRPSVYISSPAYSAFVSYRGCGCVLSEC